jgi:hypothetical protein
MPICDHLGLDQSTVVGYKYVAPLAYGAAEGAACDCISTLKQDVGSRDYFSSYTFQVIVRLLCGVMPLVRFVPKCDHADCVEKGSIHGWCSL